MIKKTEDKTKSINKTVTYFYKENEEGLRLHLNSYVSWGFIVLGGSSYKGVYRRGVHQNSKRGTN